MVTFTGSVRVARFCLAVCRTLASKDEAEWRRSEKKEKKNRRERPFLLQRRRRFRGCRSRNIFAWKCGANPWRGCFSWRFFLSRKRQRWRSSAGCRRPICMIPLDCWPNWRGLLFPRSPWPRSRPCKIIHGFRLTGRPPATPHPRRTTSPPLSNKSCRCSDRQVKFRKKVDKN